jgi:FXSXX-COOH protein
MAHGAGISDDETDLETGLVDLGGLALGDLKELDDSAIAHALRRVLADADGPEDPIAAFEAFI